MTALRWSSDFIVGEYRDVQAKVITLDCTGRFLLLPSRKQLALKDLAESIDDILLFPKVGKAEVVNASWNPHTFNKELCALCVGPCIEILWVKNCEVRTNKILRSHTRAVTDVDWHAIDPNLFASSSLDTFTYIWDTRDYQKPVISFSSFAGASHVKWNKLSSHLLATTHGGDIKIWDERKNSSPVQYITAYLSNAFCIDWSPSKQNHISTASQDGNIKIYDIREAQKPHILIKADAPVWKVSYTPFGGGNTILGVMVPETKKSESSLLMWHLSKTDVPLHTFVGHTEIVLDMEWRSFKQDESEYQLITWGKDQTLRIWEVDKHLLQLSSQDKLNIEASTFPITSADAASLSLSTLTRSKDNINIISNSERNEIILKKKTHNISSAIPIQDAKNSSDSGSSSQSTETSSTPTTISPNEESYLSIKSSDLMPANLSQEFAINFNIPNVHFDKMDAIRRLCSVTIKHNEVIVVLLINFPPSYPRNKTPVFRFIQGTTINSVLKNKLIRVLKDAAEQKVRNNEVCLEACILQVIATLDQVSNGNEEKSTVTNKSTITEPNKAFTETQESYVLTPRTCGAKFCHVGMLICFMKPKPILVDKNGIGGLQLQQRSSYLQNSNSAAPRTRYVLSQGLLKKIKISTKIHTRLVLVYDLSPLFLVNKKLAEKYVFTGNNVTAVCNKNAQIAATVGRKDLVEIWNLAMMAASSSPTNVTEHYIDWENHPFARNMIESMISHYSSVHDIQTAAMLACVFSQRKNNNEIEVKNRRKLINAALRSNISNWKWWYKSTNFPYHTVQHIETSESSTWNYTVGRHRSSSWSECLDDTKFSSCIEHGEIIDANDTPSNRQERVLKNSEFFETLKILYADLLNRWQLLIPRTLVLKCISNPSIVHRGVEFVIECCQCKNAVTGKICPHCNVPSLVCIICRLSVKGSANFCLSCGHGGHTVHMQEWFMKEKLCPSGCKCECLKKTASFFSR